MKYAVIIGSILLAAIVMFVLYRVLLSPPAVQTGAVTRGDLVTLVYATARVSADSLVTLRSKSGGLVIGVEFKEGDRVEARALMIRTDPADERLRVRSARNALATAEVHAADRTRDLHRQQSLFTSQSVTKAAVDDAQRESDLARIAVEHERIDVRLASQQLEDTEVRAPFGGVVISSSAQAGDLLAPDAECFRLMAPGSLTIEADVAEQDVARLCSGQRCIVAFDAFPLLRFEGILVRLIPLTDEATKTSRAILRLTRPPENLSIGMTATANIITEDLHGVLLVPQAAIQEASGSKRVFTYRGGKVAAVAVETGTSNGTVTRILGQSSLQESTFVVLRPAAGLTDGMHVRLE